MENEIIKENEADDVKNNQKDDIKNENSTIAEKSTTLTEADVKRIVDVAIGEFANKINLNSGLDNQKDDDDTNSVKADTDIDTNW